MSQKVVRGWLLAGCVLLGLVALSACKTGSAGQRGGSILGSYTTGTPEDMNPGLADSGAVSEDAGAR